MGLTQLIVCFLMGALVAVVTVAIRRAWERAQTIRYYEKFFDGEE